jgi:hypothetical protein
MCLLGIPPGILPAQTKFLLTVRLKVRKMQVQSKLSPTVVSLNTL